MFMQNSTPIKTSAEIKALKTALVRLESTIISLKQRLQEKRDPAALQPDNSRINELEMRVEELEEENRILREKLENQSPFFETVRNYDKVS